MSHHYLQWALPCDVCARPPRGDVRADGPLRARRPSPANQSNMRAAKGADEGASPAEVASLRAAVAQAQANGATSYTRKYRSPAVAHSAYGQAFDLRVYTRDVLTMRDGSAVLVVDMTPLSELAE